MPRKAGGIRRKRRTHKDALESTVEGNGSTSTSSKVETKTPKSFVFRRGQVPNGIRDLVPELRHALLPHTASRLRERRMNSLRDYVSIGTQVGVSHLWILSATSKGPYLRLAHVPQGPTLTFRILEYSLASDLRSMQRRPVLLQAKDLEVSPLLVMNNLNDDDIDGVSFIGQAFKHAFPPIDVNTTRLSKLRRVLLVHRDKEKNVIYIRHYALRVVATGLSKPIRKMVTKRRIPNMNKLNDVSQIVDNNNEEEDENGIVLFSSDSEIEEEENESNNKIRLAQPIKRLRRGANSRIKLVEVGPRLTLQLVKVQSGLCDGAVLFHSLISKTKEEMEEMEKNIVERKMLKRKRKEEQDANVKRKEDAKRAKKERRKAAQIGRLEKEEKEDC